jgi:sec-independent protein translocase protein TatC
MSLREHLRELRKRLFLAAIGIVVGGVGGWFLYDPLLRILQEPIKTAAEQQRSQITLAFMAIGSPLDMKIQVSIFLGLFATSPWWLYQVWAFLVPGLTKKERRYAYSFLGASVPLFIGGAALAYWVLPHAVIILTSFMPEGAIAPIDAQLYLTFVMRLLVAFGAAFVSPVLLVALNLAGVMRHETLRKGWRWAVLIAFIFAAIATPTPDPWTMCFVALPICILFFGAVGVTTLHDRRSDRRRAASAVAS